MDSSNSINLALVAVTLAVSVTVILFLYSLGLRVARILHEKEILRLQKIWWPILATATLTNQLDEIEGIENLRRGSGSKIIREWCRFRTHISHNGDNALDLLAAEFDLVGVARRLLRSNMVSNRLLAIQALGFLRDGDSWSDIEVLLNSRNATISIIAAVSLVHIDPQRAIPLILPLVAQRSNWPRTQVGKMLNLAGPAIVSGPLCHAIEAASSAQACRLLQFYESAFINEIDSLVAKLLISRRDPALLAASLKAVRGELPKPIISRLATHDMWFVRMQAASLLGRFGRREDYAILEPLLSDVEWWVRYRAAQSITKLPFLGPNALRKLCRRQKDRFARGIMRQALAEAGIL